MSFISFIIPAYNEEAMLDQTLDRLVLSAQDVLGDGNFEVIVVDDASTDRTAEIAQSHGARVVRVEKRQIAAVRNEGARQAKGDAFIFVDADTLVPEPVLHAAVIELERGAVGGGSLVTMDADLTPLGRAYFAAFMLVWRPCRCAAGCFVFARRDAFEAVGGFDERYFAGEEVWLSLALKRQGRFVIVPERVVTSGRKARIYGATNMILVGLRLLLAGPKAMQKREGLDLWYDGKR